MVIKANWKALVALVFCLLACPFLAFVCREQATHANLVFAARKAYEQSRPDPNWEVDSLDFLTRGIAAGDTRAQVEQKMEGYAEVSRNLRQESPSWHGTIDIYRFHYGPFYDNPFTGQSEPLFTEVFWVYFDEEGKAERILRHIARSDGEGGSRRTINLSAARPKGE